MSTSYCDTNETAIVATVALTELVRGDDQRLIERVSPMLHAQDVTLDLHKVDRIDAAGIAALISLYTSARSAGHVFRVCNMTARVAEILELVGLNHILVSRNADGGSQSGDCFAQSAA